MLTCSLSASTQEALRAKYNLSDEMVRPFEPVAIIRTPDLETGTTFTEFAAIDACNKYKVSQMCLRRSSLFRALL